MRLVRRQIICILLNRVSFYWREMENPPIRLSGIFRKIIKLVILGKIRGWLLSEKVWYLGLMVFLLRKSVVKLIYWKVKIQKIQTLQSNPTSPLLNHLHLNQLESTMQSQSENVNYTDWIKIFYKLIWNHYRVLLIIHYFLMNKFIFPISSWIGFVYNIRICWWVPILSVGRSRRRIFNWILKLMMMKLRRKEKGWNK